MQNADYANTVAGIILAELYVKFQTQPSNLADEVKNRFQNAINTLGIGDDCEGNLQRLTLEAIGIFTEKTDWQSFHKMLTGEYASAINAPIMLTKRISSIT